ncbi:MAG TPA: A/G-specific adenine glycosylase [Candidatus Paceibacterota bacterium]|nr:A/G-specific adenine glycosylase [Candidatus Paceibacterota bacterium]
MDRQRFKSLVMDYFRKSGRHDLPWRDLPADSNGFRDPYRIFVSEMMLQQTQVSRVLKRYDEFLKEFPDAEALAGATAAQVLRAWQGLGYNRRALLLKRAAESVVRDHNGAFPRGADELESLPGIGQSTRGAILAFAYGIPSVFIETNIRAVFLHCFFKDKKKVPDAKILPLIEETLDRKDPRSWYYALMDYGAHLKQTLPNPSRRSKHHVKQSAFKGSNREIRAAIVRFVLGGARTKVDIKKYIATKIGDTPHDIEKNIAALVREGFMKKTKSGYEA